MKVYVTRHGQVATDAEYFGDVAYPKGDMPLSALGREQARLLGERLKKEGFSGKIFVSPFLRTMETAEIIAEQTDSYIYPTSALHEIFRSDDSAANFRGSDIDKLRELFPRVARDAELAFPWWAKRAENSEDVRYRVAIGLQGIMKEEDDVLVVGHGASVGAVMNYLIGFDDRKPFFNCSYSVFDSQTKTCTKNCARHLPYEMMTYNSRYAKDAEYEIDIPEQLSCEDEKKILHVGDTFTNTYPWYRSLIKKLKPDIIIHTGDTADELKVSRDFDAHSTYLDRVKLLFEIFRESGAEVYWTRGNNDLEEQVKKIAPFIKVVEPGSILNIEGKRIGVAHEKQHLPEGADVYLYGHSTRYEIWSNERNTDESDVWYLNAMWAASVLILPKRKLYSIDVPKLK